MMLFLLLLLSPLALAFAPQKPLSPPLVIRKGAESEVTFGDLDGTDARIGIIRTRWNDQYVSSIVEGIRTSLKECNVKEENIFETEVPGSFELPLAAKFLAMTGTVDAIVCCGVLIKGDTLHFEYICEAVSSGIMSVGLQTSTPIVFGVLTCLNEEQVKKRSIGKDNHGLDWGKTAVEMALLKNEAVGLTKGKSKLKDLGFQVDEKAKEKKNKVPGFF